MMIDLPAAVCEMAEINSEKPIMIAKDFSPARALARISGR